MKTHWEIELEGHRLAAVLTHSGNSDLPVFFLHGIGGSISFWIPEETSLFHHLGSCYSLSLPGHFPAVFPKNFAASSLTPELIVRLLSGAIQRIVGHKKVLLVGHSTGGFAALCTAICAPDIAAGVVSIGGFSKGEWTGMLGFGQWLVRQGPIGYALFKKIFQLAEVNRTVYRLFWHIYASDHLALVKYPHFGKVVNSTYPYAQKLNLDSMISYYTVMPNIDITPDLSKVQVPTCIIVGDKDPIVPSRQSSTIAEKIPGSNLTILKGCGHLPFFERPVEYKIAVNSWLADFRSAS